MTTDLLITGDTSNIRSLAEPKIAASLRANSAPNLPAGIADLAELPTAVEATKGYTLPLTCSRTGITVGSINIATVAGHMPMIGQWRDSMILHPLFSLPPMALIHFAKNTWFRYCNFSLEEGSNDKLVDKQEQMLQIAGLVLLHNLTEVRQDVPWLPPFKDVSSHWSSLMAISYWKNYLDSQRFKFPSIHLSKLEANDFSLHDYLTVCWQVKKSYESTVNEKIELEKVKAAEAATIALRDMLTGARPTSNRQLWRWFVATLPRRYKKDLETWMPEIFFSKGEEIRRFTLRDIDLLEEIFLCECPKGSSISHAFSEILSNKRQYLQQHFEAFEIIIPQEISAAKAAGTISATEPQLQDYPSRVQWMIARAKWKLAHTDLQKYARAAAERNEQLSVKASYIPTLELGNEGDSDSDDSDSEEIEPTEAFIASREDDDEATSGELEL